MKKLIVLILLSFFFCIYGIHAQYHLVWHDEFNYEGHLDSTRWNYEVGGHGWGNNELQYYTKKRLKNARVENGKFIIEAHNEHIGGNDYSSARVTTTNKGDWSYGRIEIKAKLPAGRGTWPAIWMLPTEWIYGDGSWPDNGEIDIMEHVGYDPGVIHGTIHTNAYNHADGTQKGNSITVPDATSAFHVYAIEWTKNEINWFVDGEQYFKFSKLGGWKRWPFDHPFHLILNIAVGGSWGGAEGIDDSIFPAKMEIDYVRVYQTTEQMGGLVDGPCALPAKAKEITFSAGIKNAESYRWEVPEGANIVGSSEENTVTVNWGCNPGIIHCTINTADTVYKAKKKIELKGLAIQGPLFYDKGDKPLNFSVPDLSGTTFKWDLPDEATFVRGDSTHSVLVDWPERKDSIELNISNSCGNQSLVHTVWVPGIQYPYPDPSKAILIPDTINPVFYDYGGAGLAYYDSDIENLGNGIRQNEGVDTETRDNGYGNIGWINDGEWVEYSIEVKREMIVTLSLRVASDEDSPGSIDILMNGNEKAAGVNVRNTGGWSSFERIETGKITLTPEDTIIRLAFKQGGFNLGRINVKETESGLEDKKPAEPVRCYPNPVGNTLYLFTQKDIDFIEIIDLRGNILYNEHIAGTPLRRWKKNIQNLTNGLYLLHIGFLDNSTHTLEFYKK